MRSSPLASHYRHATGKGTSTPRTKPCTNTTKTRATPTATSTFWLRTSRDRAKGARFTAILPSPGGGCKRYCRFVWCFIAYVWFLWSCFNLLFWFCVLLFMKRKTRTKRLLLLTLFVVVGKHINKDSGVAEATARSAVAGRTRSRGADERPLTTARRQQLRQHNNDGDNNSNSKQGGRARYKRHRPRRSA